MFKSHLRIVIQSKLLERYDMLDSLVREYIKTKRLTPWESEHNQFDMFHILSFWVNEHSN